jgi:hypothetical protein
LSPQLAVVVVVTTKVDLNDHVRGLFLETVQRRLLLETIGLLSCSHGPAFVFEPFRLRKNRGQAPHASTTSVSSHEKHHE